MIFKKKDKTEYNEARNRVQKRAIAQDVMMSLDFVGSWVKDENFNFLEISEQTARLLFNLSSNECIGRNDYEIAKSCGLDMSETQFGDICRASDNYTKHNQQPVTFIELLEDTKGNKHIWKTIKCTKILDGKEYHYGFATFCDVIRGSYEKAYEMFQHELPRLEKINETLYVYNIDK